MLALIIGKPTVISGVAIMQRGGRVIPDDPDLGAKPNAANEQVVGIDRLLQMHQVGAALVVKALEVLGGFDPAHPGPTTPIVGFDVHRVANLLAQFLQIEHLGVLLQRCLQIWLVYVLLGRHHPRCWNLHPQAHHGAIRGVLFVGLDGPGIVEDIKAIEEDRFLDPLSACAVPMGEAVDDHVITGWLTQVERLDPHPIHVETNRVIANLQREIETLEDLLVTDRPANIRPQ